MSGLPNRETGDEFSGVEVLLDRSCCLRAFIMFLLSWAEGDTLEFSLHCRRR